MGATAEEQTYTYARPSELVFGDGRADLVLATSGGRTATGPAAHPRVLRRVPRPPEQTAVALLAVARVARTRFYTPPGMLAAILRAADPVVTSNGDRLRFESFSACCGVYARSTRCRAASTGRAGHRHHQRRLQPADARGARPGRRPRPAAPAVGRGRRRSRTLDADGDREEGAAARAVAEGLRRGAARRRHGRHRSSRSPRPRRGGSCGALPSSGSRKPVWVVPAGRGLRMTSARRPPSGVSLCRTRPAQAARAAAAVRDGRCARTPRPHDTPGAGAASGSWSWTTPAWSSPSAPSPAAGSPARGECSGTSPTSSPPTTRTSCPPCWPSSLGSTSRASLPSPASPRSASLRALGRLGAAGRVGYDAAEAAYFHRELPYDAERLASDAPSTARRRLPWWTAGAVRIDGEAAHVTSGDTEHVVRRTADGDRCTCPWYAKHKGSRGPCKHVLAADLVRKQHA